ncbi:hypothetical protein C8J35_1085 [Rhizobium sp. PP-F2F-G38]|uniref:hypothetical protein n=1 Tax=unclassified Rhizobium TaxID=2613769 RepID=UPI000794F2C0|nr:hypothetical protein [Rhizobium sp. 9140]PYE26651.1 hypothetical protein C8J32_102267 [Rhizobium sp. PP-CC-3A-592]PYE45249.1 hypothetical protein DFI02_102693 [Rhizobium sp. PP-F2F-G20b]PYE95276.1 hypothetical protein C8J35_1085 [Rhizobium sp. PP-F2F-G38]TCL91074.1 hypothetical protein C8J38_1066 [Rhizobium sp. PP-WC-2G-219]TCP85047.1 hypothetical protein C8J31_10713 [Rhizobium sp. PP-CC-2G-626]TCQ10355.1 hypothetical protein C8J34_102765 [Rhizobium sp. PP-F2F-G36]TCQ27564.1 hypothetical 
MPAWIFSCEFSLLGWAARRPDEVSRFAPTLRILALAFAVFLSLAAWALIIAVIVWLIP